VKLILTLKWEKGMSSLMARDQDLYPDHPGGPDQDLAVLRLKLLGPSRVLNHGPNPDQSRDRAKEEAGPSLLKEKSLGQSQAPDKNPDRSQFPKKDLDPNLAAELAPNQSLGPGRNLGPDLNLDQGLGLDLNPDLVLVQPVGLGPDHGQNRVHVQKAGLVLAVGHPGVFQDPDPDPGLDQDHAQDLDLAAGLVLTVMWRPRKRKLLQMLWEIQMMKQEGRGEKR
jgi:hypothetical protein